MKNYRTLAKMLWPKHAWIAGLILARIGSVKPIAKKLPTLTRLARLVKHKEHEIIKAKEVLPRRKRT